MFQLINSMLLEFRGCFKRTKTWQWFVVLVMGLMVRSNLRGVTSILSSLRLKPDLYHTMLRFFRSKGYDVPELYEKWVRVLKKRVVFKRVSGRMIVIGDHIKVSKEGLRMPDIEILHQDSQNSGKAEYIAGHNFGQVSGVITNGTVSRSIPLMTEIQKSPPRIEGTKKPDGDTIVTQMVNLVHRAAKALGEPVVAALDAYFSSESAWTAADKAITETGERLVEIVTRAQTNSVAYTIPKPPAKKKRGRPKIYGNKLKLYSLFSDMSCFTKTSMVLYGRKMKVSYRSLDLIWKPVKKLVRFVIVSTETGSCVLMSSDLTLSPEAIIEIYALRFKIETSFDEQKNVMGCFDYHFWTAALPKRCKRKKAAAAMSSSQAEKAADARRAIESFVCLGNIATGILSIIAFSHNREIWNCYPGWIKTLRSDIPTVLVVKEALAAHLSLILQRFPFLPLCSIIRYRMRVAEFLYQDFAA